MPTVIDPKAHVMTMINVFKVMPEYQDVLVRLLEDATAKAMRHQPGFISANIHKSLDGKSVINYAQWRSRADFDSMQQDPLAMMHMKRAAALADFDNIVCEVSSSYG